MDLHVLEDSIHQTVSRAAPRPEMGVSNKGDIQNVQLCETENHWSKHQSIPSALNDLTEGLPLYAVHGAEQAVAQFESNIVLSMQNSTKKHLWHRYTMCETQIKWR